MPMPVKPQLKPDSSVREKAYLLIQRKIASGELRAGSAISELALARELGSSRTPIREAIGQLVAEGLLDQTPNRGAVVKKLTRQDIVDLFELREALEVYAVAKAARQAPRVTDIERLQSLADEILPLQEELKRSKAKTLEARLREYPGVKACAIRLMRPEEGRRLKAFVVLEADRPAFEAWVAKQFEGPEELASLTYGTELPVNAQGKLSDWKIPID